MTGEARSPSAGSLPLPLQPDSGGRAALRRRATLGLALLGLAVLAVPVVTGTRLPRAGSAMATPERKAAPRAAAAETAPRAAPRADRGFAVGVDLERARAQTQPRALGGRPVSDRVVPPTQATALFAQRSWYVPPPPEPVRVVPPPPPPEPTAPPFPYAFIGSYAPQGDPPVFFLSRGDRVIDVRVGDALDGVYRFESATSGQLVFVYLPLNTRQNLPTGAPQ